MKKITFLLALCLISLGMFAAPRTPNEVEFIAKQFIQTQRLLHKNAVSSPVKLQLVYKANNSDSQPAYYIFDKTQGFVIVSGDDQLPEILGYVDHGSFDWDTAPEAFKVFMSQYEQKVVISHKNKCKVKNIKSLKASKQSVAPLLGGTIWNQSSPWNDLCPSGTNNQTGERFRSAVGCAATAVAQILYYHKYPVVGTGIKHSYYTRTYNFKVSSNFNTPYDWDNMLPAYSGSETITQKKAVAHLNYDVGVSMDMNYGPSSGTMTYYALNCLPKYFNYDADMTHLYRECYTYDEWVSILKAELDADRPILYAGYSKEGGHAYVCDGYNDELFHINWGWNGMCNGYFYLYALVPESQGIGGGSADGFNYYQMATMGIHPPDNQDGLGVRNCLLYSRLSFSNTQFSNSDVNSVEFNRLYNMSSDFVGQVSAELMTQSTHALVKELGTTSNLSIDFEDYRYNNSLNLDFNGVNDGDYYMVFKESASNSDVSFEVRNMTSASVDSIPVTVVNGEVTITAPQHRFDMQCNAINVTVPNDKIYRNSLAKISFDLTNNGTYDFNSEYCLKLKSGYTTKNFAQYMVYVKKGTTQHVELLVDVPFLSLGDAELKLYVNETNSSWKSEDSDLVQIFSRSIQIESNPDGDPEFRLDRKIAFKNAGSVVNSDAALLDVSITNHGGIGQKEIWAIIWSESGQAITYKSKAMVLDKDETKSLEFDFSGSPLKDGQTYSLTVRMKSNGDWESFSNDSYRYIRFNWHNEEVSMQHIVLEDVYFDGHLLHNQMNKKLKVYDTLGKVILQSSASNIDLTPLLRGVYLVSDGHSILKIVK